jgi:hypothetical protein
MRDVNLRNLATKLGEVAQLNPYQIPAAMQGVVRDLRGNITGFRDASGIFTGVDPFQVQNTPGEADDQMPQLTAPEPQTGRCPDGYVFDQQLNACRLVTRPDDAAVTAPPAAGTYARMSLLDQAPAGLDHRRTTVRRILRSGSLLAHDHRISERRLKWGQNTDFYREYL